MWHEARKQERKIRGLMVDFKKRADRRREFYEKIKLDPTQFLRVYGRPCKINLDPSVAIAAESPQTMMPWQGDTSNMIDRFDVRAHLDIIPDSFSHKTITVQLSRDEDLEERQANYERFRTLVENEASGLTEEQCLNEIFIDEHFGLPASKQDEDKKKNTDKKAAIGYTYEDSTHVMEDEQGCVVSEEEDEESSDTDVETADLDVTLDIDLLTPDLEKEINSYAISYGMKDHDFIRLLRKDKEEIEAMKYAKQMEEEKAQFSGRKSRRERRAFKEKQMLGRRLSPPSYAARSSPKYEPYRRTASSSRSRTRSPEDVGKVKFITSFGAESDEDAAAGGAYGPSLPSSTGSNKSARSSVNDSHSDKNRHSSWRTKGRPLHLRSRSGQSRSRSKSPCSSSWRSDSQNKHKQARRSPSQSYDYYNYHQVTRDYPSSRDMRDNFMDQGRFGRYDRDYYDDVFWEQRANRPSTRLDYSSHRNSYSSRTTFHVDRRSHSRSRDYVDMRSSPPRSRAHIDRKHFDSISRTDALSRTEFRCSRSRSTSRTQKSPQSSRSKSKFNMSRNKPESKERSKSNSPKPATVIKRYRRDSLSSKSSMSEDDENRNNSVTSSTVADSMDSLRTKSESGSGLLGNTAPTAQGKLTPQERLRRRMQAQLNRQYKADKRAEITKISKLEQERMDREEEMRSRTVEMRRREREKRHRELEDVEHEQEHAWMRHETDSDGEDECGHYCQDNSGSDDNGHTPTAPRRPVSKLQPHSQSSEACRLVSY